MADPDAGAQPSRRASILLAAATALAGGLAGPKSRAAPRAAPLADLKPGAVILFQGDSITEGGRQPGGDPNHSMGQDYAFVVAAEIGSRFPEHRLTFVNRGISGDTVVDLAARWDRDVIAERPDLLSILVGVNDVLSSKAEPLEVYERTYDELLARTFKALPGVRIVLGQSFLLPVGSHKANYVSELAQIRQRQGAVERLCRKYRLPMIRYQQAFDAALARAPAEHWSWDGVHPTFAGHGLMARTWIETLSR